MSEPFVPTARTPVMDPGTYTATQVLEWVIERIKEEPLRLRMTYWTSMIRGEDMEFMPKDGRLPACGTVCCVGGWICVGTGAVGMTGYNAIHTLFNNGNPYHTKYSLALWRIFMRTRADAPGVITLLEDYVREYREKLDSYKVVVK